MYFRCVSSDFRPAVVMDALLAFLGFLLRFLLLPLKLYRSTDFEVHRTDLGELHGTPRMGRVCMGLILQLSRVPRSPTPDAIKGERHMKLLGILDIIGKFIGNSLRLGEEHIYIK